MRKTLLCLLTGLAGCTAGTYAYTFDSTDPGAHNLTEPGARDSLEDADVKTELLVDPTNFRAIALDVTNKTDGPLQIQWDNITYINPDGTEGKLHPDSAVPPADPGAKIEARLVSFELPSQGAMAAAYNNQVFQLVVPMIVRGQPREYRYHLIAYTHKL